MRIARINTVLFLLFLLLLINLPAKENSKSHKIFEQAGISIEKLKTIDSELRELVLNQITNSKQSYKTTRRSAGMPVYKIRDNQTYISVFLKSSSPEITKNKIEANGGVVSNIIEDILIAEMPVNNITELLFDYEIERVETAKYQETQLDTSLSFINVDKVHEGENLPRAYKGKGVIVGVLDSGIDWTHPAFNNENGNRILYLWDMSDDSNPPAEFDYGTEYTKTDLDQQNSNQIDDDGHGTHVASTAAGNADGDNYPLDGVAPEADIIFVKGYRNNPYFEDNDIINGCDYIFKRAEQLNKPCVINLSLGALDGRTGNSLLEEALTNLVSGGKLIAAAAGNQGHLSRHLQYKMTGSSFDERSTTIWNISDPSREESDITGYPESEDFNVGLEVIDQTENTVFTSSILAHNDELIESIIIDNDTLATLALSGIPTVVEPYLFSIKLDYSPDSGIENYTFSLFTYGSAQFNAWVNNGTFATDSDPSENLIGGDNLMTINYPSSAHNVFSIGAFTTKTSWVDIDGNPYSVSGIYKDRAYFSSIGPLRDGRIKPDFSAPGHWIAAGYSKDANYPVSYIINEKTVVFQGTSMATPHFTGVIALLLEQNPNLTYEQVLEILKNTAITDDITGSVPNNEFGHGRIDAHAALQSLITSIEDGNSIPVDYNLSQNYPNPFNPSTTINFSIPKQKNVSLKVYDVLGKEVAELVNEEKPAGNYKIDFDASNLSSGIYIYTLKTNEFLKARKMMLIK